MKSRLSVFLILIGLSVNAQRLEYKLKAGGVQLGNFSIERHQLGDSTIYLLETNVTLNFLFTKHRVKYSSVSAYYQDTLVYSKVKAVENGELDKYTTTKRINKGYRIEKYEDEDTTKYEILHKGITNSSSRMFYNKPQAADSSYAELYGNFGAVSKEDGDCMMITNLKTGSKTRYYYKTNNPYKRKIEYTVCDFNMFLTETKPVIRDYLMVKNSLDPSQF